MKASRPVEPKDVGKGSKNFACESLGEIVRGSCGIFTPDSLTQESWLWEKQYHILYTGFRTYWVLEDIVSVLQSITMYLAL